MTKFVGCREKVQASGSHLVMGLGLRRLSIWSVRWSVRVIPSEVGTGGGEGLPSSCDACVATGVAAGVRGDWTTTYPAGLQCLLSMTVARGGGAAVESPGVEAAGNVGLVVARMALLVVPLWLAGLAHVPLAVGCWMVLVAEEWP